MTSLKLLKKNFGFAESDINNKNAWAFLYLRAFKKNAVIFGARSHSPKLFDLF